MILTSRNEGVGLHADPACFAFTPKILTHEESWKLCAGIALSRIDKTGTFTIKNLLTRTLNVISLTSYYNQKSCGVIH